MAERKDNGALWGVLVAIGLVVAFCFYVVGDMRAHGDFERIERHSAERSAALAADRRALERAAEAGRRARERHGR